MLYCVLLLHCSLQCFLASFPDSEVIYRNSDGHVIKFNILTNETEIILPNSTFVSIKLFQQRNVLLIDFKILQIFILFLLPLSSTR